jgi:Holliday junction resolvase
MPDGAAETRLLHLIHRLFAEHGGTLDETALAKRLHRLQLGIPRQDEFAALLYWLARCELAHQLDQSYPAGTEYQVPDLLAIFSYRGRRLPVLVEVKSTKGQVLHLPIDQLERLERYAAAVQLPLLIAWKFRPWDLWVLFEPSHFLRRDRWAEIRITDAIPQTLMSELAGDFSYALEHGFGWHLKIRKLERRSFETLAPGEGMPMEIERSYLARRDGAEVDIPHLFWLLLAVDDEVQLTEDDTHVFQNFVVPEVPSSQWAQRVFVAMLRFAVSESPDVRWYDVVRERKWAASADDLRRAAAAGVAAGAVHHRFDIRPRAMATFLDSMPGET